jgi:hypothetical protein
LVRASGVLTFSGVAVNAQTVTIGGKVYTTQTTLTDVDGNVLIGADQTATAANLAAAINLGAGAGTTYATSMTENPHVAADATAAAGVLTVRAKIPGAVGNLVDTTETQTNAAWGAATLASGSGDFSDAIAAIMAYAQVNSEVIQALDALDELVSGIAPPEA